jgi:drug/metabolite transporter (DMT)-like permease
MRDDVSLAEALRPAALRNGILLGVGAVLIWGGYLAYSRLGVTQGLRPPDFAMLRFGVAGLIMLPYLARRGLFDFAGVGFWRTLALTACAGPVFMLIVSGGYVYAPLPHGAVIPPSAMTVSSLLLAALVLGDHPSRARLAGVGVILVGLACVAGSGLMDDTGRLTWLGDILFAVAGFLWAVFTVLQKRWGIDPMQATAAMSVMSLILLLPPFLVWWSFEPILALPPSQLAIQVVVQGVLAGVVAVVAFAAAVVILGASRAALFPPLVPACAILIGIPITGEWPSPLQWIGIAVVTLGLIAAMGVRLPALAGAKKP